MPVTRLDEAPGFNASAHSKALDANVKKADGSSYSVFQQTTSDALPPFVSWLRKKVRDKTNELVANANDQQKRIVQLEADVKALQEAPPPTPFP